jgi:hypothetical protein
MLTPHWLRAAVARRFPPSPRDKTRRRWLAVEALEDRCTPSTFRVTNTNDAGAGSLRQAVERANADRGADRIVFAIPTADAGFVDASGNGAFDPGDYWTIALGSALPDVTDRVVIDGWSQRGPNYRGRPVIELNGAGAGTGADGLTLDRHAGSTIRGLVINRFDGSGIVIDGGGWHELHGNFLGTDAAGTSDQGNTQAGVFVRGGKLNEIGGTGTGEGNLISGNDLQGIHIEGAASVGNRIQGNLIGTTVTGDTALANGTERYLGDGVRVEGGRFNLIGGTSGAARNVISGNFDDGIDLRDGADGNAVLGNYVGADVTGRQGLGNGADGIFLQDASHNLIGSVITGDANVIAANGYNGVFLYGDSHDNVIARNFIGTNARRDPGLGNGTVADFADGVFLAQFGTPQGPSRNRIVANTIAFNADSAVAVDVDPAANTAGNSILANAIFGNRSLAGGAAIDLASDGVTPNDPGDGDAGPNRRQNFPVLQAPVSSGGGTSTVAGTLNSRPNSVYLIEFYASSRSGEGEVLLGSVVVVTGADGNSGLFHFRYRPVVGKPFITATATSLSTGDTSEFSAPVS